MSGRRSPRSVVASSRFRAATRAVRRLDVANVQTLDTGLVEIKTAIGVSKRQAALHQLTDASVAFGFMDLGEQASRMALEYAGVKSITANLIIGTTVGVAGPILLAAALGRLAGLRTLLLGEP